MKNIFCVEDNAEMRILIHAALDGFHVDFATTLKEAAQKLSQNKYDLILLDLGLPDGDGISILATAPQNNLKDTPIIILTSKDEVSQKILAFSVGAEDYINKPFHPLELKARVAAKLRKKELSESQQEEFVLGDLNINVPKQKVWLTGTDGKITISLTSIEFRLLITLARQPERIYSRDQLLSEVWGSEVNITDRTVDTHIGHLRKKMAGSRLVKLETVISEGYRISILATNAKR